ncbi:hypothetical protein [Spiroplasma endosymbiont of Polydrusus formosus]|uniref:hypothetical protein n=1 Tax=Spiroplasma endosymbiont of Polydrusus formosus TaxID=3139326 RepID=UPI0035B54890
MRQKRKNHKNSFDNIIIKVSRFSYYDDKEKKFKTTTLLNKSIGLKNNQTIILIVKISIWKNWIVLKAQIDIKDMFFES